MAKAPLAHAVLLARLIEELLPGGWEEAAQLCSSALDGAFDFEAAKARLQELRPCPDPDDELERLAGAFPMIERAQVVKLEAGVPYAMIVSSKEHLCAATHDRLAEWCRAANAKMGWDLQILVLEGKAMCVSFVQKAELTPAFKPKPN